MNIHHYSKSTGEYLRTIEARESPLEPGVFIIPAFATDKELPVYHKNEIPMFRGGNWEIAIDFRGTYYDAERNHVVVTSIGVHAPEGCTAEPAPYTQEELDAIEEKVSRDKDLNEALSKSKIHNYSIEKLDKHIADTIDEATDIDQVKKAVKKLFKDFSIYLLK